MVQRVAAVHDPSGKSFNVEPVTTSEDGHVVTLASIARKKEKERRREEEAAAKANNVPAPLLEPEPVAPIVETLADDPSRNPHYVNPERLRQLVKAKTQKPRGRGLSKTQQRKQEQNPPRPPPPKPTIPDGVQLPDDEDEPWLDLWDLSDEDVERRVVRAKRRAAQERKNLRIKQKEGKAERRAARDEKRRVYRELKQSWKVIREEERRRRKFLKSMEDEEGKRLAVQVNKKLRKDALDCAAKFGVTLENVEGAKEITPRLAGKMKGMDVDWQQLEFIGDTSSGLKFADGRTTLQKAIAPPKTKGGRSNRVNLGAIASEAHTQSVLGQGSNRNHSGGINSDFVQFGVTDDADQNYEDKNLNHKLRRKLRRALEMMQIKKEMIVRKKAIEYCQTNNIPVPPELLTPERPINQRGERCMPNGLLETAKQERVRQRVELTEFNKMARVLRAQAKAMSIEAGMRVYLELMGRIPKREGADALIDGRRHEADEGRPMTAAEFLASWTVEGLDEEASRVEKDYGMEDEYYRRGEESDLEDLDGELEMSGGTEATQKPQPGANGTRHLNGAAPTKVSSEILAAGQLDGETLSEVKAKATNMPQLNEGKDAESDSSTTSSSEADPGSESDTESSRSSSASEDEDEDETKYEADGDAVMRDA